MAIINGKQVEVENTTLNAYLQSEGLQIERIAVEVNGEILKRTQYGSYIIKKDDKIEIVTFVGGG